MEQTIKVYGCYGSFCTQKVYLTLAEKGVGAERRSINIGPPMENYEPWYAKINPGLVVPTLDDRGTIVCDSSRIIHYIDKEFAGPALMPAAPESRARVDTWIERIDRLAIRELSYSTMSGALARLRDRFIMPRRLAVLERHKAAHPELEQVYADRIADVSQWIETMHCPADIASLRAELESVLDDLESALGEHAFVEGNQYTLADVMATVLIARVRLMKFSDLSARPALVEYFQRMKARPRFPANDVIETLDRRRLFALVGPYMLRRVGVVVVVLVMLGFGLWALMAD